MSLRINNLLNMDPGDSDKLLHVEGWVRTKRD